MIVRMYTAPGAMVTVMLTQDRGAHADTTSLIVAMFRVLPRLRQHAVVPVDVVRVMPQLALLDVLLDRSLALALHCSKRRSRLMAW